MSPLNVHNKICCARVENASGELTSSSDMPPERNIMPGTAEGTWRSNDWIVSFPMSSLVALSVKSIPGQTIDGFSSEPSR